MGARGEAQCINMGPDASAGAEIWRLRSGQTQDVSVDMRHAVVECRSERYMRVDGKPPPPAWDAPAEDQRLQVRALNEFPNITAKQGVRGS